MTELTAAADSRPGDASPSLADVLTEGEFVRPRDLLTQCPFISRKQLYNEWRQINRKLLC